MHLWVVSSFLWMTLGNLVPELRRSRRCTGESVGRRYSLAEMNWIVNIDDVLPIFVQHTPAHTFAEEEGRLMSNEEKLLLSIRRWSSEAKENKMTICSLTIVLVKTERWRFLSFIMAGCVRMCPWRMFFRPEIIFLNSHFDGSFFLLPLHLHFPGWLIVPGSRSTAAPRQNYTGQSYQDLDLRGSSSPYFLYHIPELSPPEKDRKRNLNYDRFQWSVGVR